MARIMRWWLFVGVGFYLCSVLTVLPLPLDYQWYRPQWLLMFIIYCQLVQPTKFNALWAWVIGLFMDGLLGSHLGHHALIFSVICYLTALLRWRFILRPFWQQVGKIFLLVCLGQILDLWFHMFVRQNPHTLFYWMATLSSCLIWPLFVTCLQGICRFFNAATHHPSPRSI